MMPVESNIELGSGHLYFDGVGKPVPVGVGEFTTEDVWADDAEYISMSTEPVEFECTAEFNREWTLVNCCQCGGGMPVTEFWALLYGRDQWICPECKYKEAVIEALGRSK